MSQTGIIVRGVGGFYDVNTGSRIIRCRARGRFRKQGMTPLVGDRVIIQEIGGGEGVLEKITERKNQLFRPPVANVDYLGIVIAVKDPQPDFMLVDKLMICGKMNRISPLLLINKIDLAPCGEVESIVNVYKTTGYPVLPLSAKFGQGIEDLKAALKKGIIVFAGQSGVGKSSIINSLCPGLSLKTGEISQKTKRGRHTTRHVELLVLPDGGMVVDTPGFSLIDFQQLVPDELHYYYPEFARFYGQCRFSGCLHHHEPGCVIKEMVERGKISRERYMRYVCLLEELKSRRRDA